MLYNDFLIEKYVLGENLFPLGVKDFQVVFNKAIDQYLLFIFCWCMILGALKRDKHLLISLQFCLQISVSLMIKNNGEVKKIADNESNSSKKKSLPITFEFQNTVFPSL